MDKIRDPLYIYPDVIECAASKTDKGHVIKFRHNVGGLSDGMALELIEPLRALVLRYLLWR